MPLALFTLGARGVAFFVPVVIAGWFGVNGTVDAFYYALGVPAALLMLFGSAVATLLVPALARTLRDRPDHFGVLAGTAAGWTGLVGGLVGVAAAIVMPMALPWLSGFPPEAHALVVTFCWGLAPFQAVLGAATALRSALEVEGAYGASLASPMIRAVTQLATTWVLREHGPTILPVGIFLGALAELLWIGLWLARTGHVARFAWSEGPAVRLALVGLGPVALGEGLVALQVVVDKAFASGLPTGSVTLLEYADRVRLIPQTLLEGAVVTVAFATWARHAAAGDDDARERSIAAHLWSVGMVAAPMLAAMAVAREPLVRFLFERGAFTAEWTPPTAHAVLGFLPGVWFALLGALAVKAQLLLGRTRLVFGLGFASFVLNIAFDALFAPRLGLFGLTLATTLVTAIVTTTSLVLLRPRRSRVPELVGVVGLSVALAALLPAPTGALYAPGTILLLLPFGLLFGYAAWRSR